jgi:hypothetical protein
MFVHFYPADPGTGEEYVVVVLMVSLSKTPLVYHIYQDIRYAIISFGDIMLNFMFHVPFKCYLLAQSLYLLLSLSYVDL